MSDIKMASTGEEAIEVGETRTFPPTWNNKTEQNRIMQVSSSDQQWLTKNFSVSDRNINPDMENSLSNSVDMSPSQRRGVKRKIELNDSNTGAKVTRLANSGGANNALCLLHKMYRGLDFKIINQEGPVHAPIFTASVEVNGILFEGRGRNKKTAKHSAAEAALRSIVQFKNPSSEAPQVSTTELIDFTSDVLCKEVNSFDMLEATESDVISNGQTSENGVKELRLASTKPQAIEKNPVMLLNELYPNARYELISEKGQQSCKYTMAVYINGQRFEEKGSSKKLSKAAAARSALLSFHNLSIPAHPTRELGKPFLVSSRGDAAVPQVFCDNISRLVNSKFLSVMEDQQHTRRKVLAGFVMSDGYSLESCQVIAIGTGTKCINGERMSVNGMVLNDSHAEIIARRCLCKFFYGELEKHLDKLGNECSIFERHEDGFRIKGNYKFHLYISSAPCGDSRIFSPYDEYQVDKHPNRKARGQLRTKIECGEGTIPVKSSDLIQTWDGVLQGERLLTMSCSDKIAKWNVVGLQGALLSNFIEPVYIDSLILGSLFHPHHLHRAVSGRIENTILGLPPPYRLNEPKLATILNSESRQVGKTPNFSINWTIGDERPEIVNAVFGRTEQNQVSRLSKSMLFYRFLRLAGRIPSFTGLGLPRGPLTYGSCKQMSTKFQIAKKQLFEAFSKAKLGEWIKKPLEVDQFDWDEESLSGLLSINSLNGAPS